MIMSIIDDLIFFDYFSDNLYKERPMPLTEEQREQFREIAKKYHLTEFSKQAEIRFQKAVKEAENDGHESTLVIPPRPTRKI